MLPLPIPEKGGRISALRKYLNVSSDDDFALAVFWLVAALRPQGPYPVLGLSGEHGSAKSTFARVVRALVDPNCLAIRGPPHDERDLFIAAGNSHVLAFDNLSDIQPWLSDALCVLSTDGAFGTRKLWTDDEEQLFKAKRPIVVNGITNAITAPDLADRALSGSSSVEPTRQRGDKRAGIAPLRMRSERMELMARALETLAKSREFLIKANEALARKPLLTPNATRDVRFWYLTDTPMRSADVRFWRQRGHQFEAAVENKSGRATTGTAPKQIMPQSPAIAPSDSTSTMK
jgi:hypothetical protein